MATLSMAASSGWNLRRCRPLFPLLFGVSVIAKNFRISSHTAIGSPTIFSLHLFGNDDAFVFRSNRYRRVLHSFVSKFTIIESFRSETHCLKDYANLDSRPSKNLVNVSACYALCLRYFCSLCRTRRGLEWPVPNGCVNPKSFQGRRLPASR